MLSLSNYDRVVSQIYEAALVPAQWDIALTSLINLFGPREWEVAMILWERLDPPAGRFIGAAGVHQLARDAYLGHFAGRQEWSRRGHDMRAGRVAHSDELIPREEFRETPFYRHYLEPWGFEVALIGNLDRHGKDHLGIICPGPPDLDPGDLHEAIVRLLPHFQRAVRISRRIGEVDMRAAAATDLLDNSPYSVMALGPRLELLLANGPAQAMVELGGGLAITNNELKIADPAAAQQLQAMASGNSDQHACTFSVTAGNGQRLLLQAVTVTSAQSDQFAGAAAGASLMIIGGQRMDVSETAIAALQQGFDLTAAEARLAAFLIEGSGVQGYARARGVSQEAGRYLLKSIYAKTGLSNQVELAALLREVPLGWGGPLGRSALPG
jgi:DNA-binding CsgD family transcriptional regulator